MTQFRMLSLSMLCLEMLCLGMLCLGVLPSMAQTPVPIMRNVDPGRGTIGAVLRVNGVNLDIANVDEVYLTDHALDMKVKVLEQTEKSIKFRIPPSVKPGRLQLVVKTTGKLPKLLEQPVYITVEEKEVAEMTASSH
jgi:hypothetical protein